MDISRILRAVRFAVVAHEGQYRKDGTTPYIVHPIEVAGVLSEALSDSDYFADMNTEAVMAAILHDTIEDTDVEAGHIEAEFGPEVSRLVQEVTEDKTEGNRSIRKNAYRRKLADASSLGKSIKAADVICNSSTVRRDDPDFAESYLKEQKRVLEVLEGADKQLLLAAKEIVNRELEGI